ncbi:MAG: hypothetical protein ACR2OO_00825 [Thermomicrobiales bacterium]
MRWALPVRVSARPEMEAAGPKPFSQEWLQAPPEEGSARPSRHRFTLPAWLPSERALASLLVILLVLTSALVGDGGMPRSEARGAIPAAAVTPTDRAAQILQSPTAPIAAPPTSAPTTAPTAATSPAPSEVAAAATSVSNFPQADSDPRALLPKNRILAYYGHPNSDKMGILGEYDKDALLAELLKEKEAWAAADPSRPVLPAFELISSVAQPNPGEDGTYLLHTGQDQIQEYVDFTRDNGLLLILDLQIGHSTVEAELERIKPWLLLPHVQVAIDPEFSMGPGEVPGDKIGGIDAADVTLAQNFLVTLAVENNLPPKVLIVHRFAFGMIRDDKQVAPIDGVQLVIDADGFGSPGLKQEGYNVFAKERGIQYAGVKLFYKQDVPLMQPDQALALDPPPDVVIYQ